MIEVNKDNLMEEIENALIFGYPGVSMSDNQKRIVFYAVLDDLPNCTYEDERDLVYDWIERVMELFDTTPCLKLCI